MSLARNDPRHGTINGYTNLACRCKRCCKANTDRVREYMHRTGQQRPLDVYLAERRADPPPHGSESRYASPHNCRCDECRAASAEGRRRRRAKDAA